MITLKQYQALDFEQKETVRFMIVSLIISELEKNQSISLAKRKVHKTNQFSQNLIWYVYDNSDDLINLVKLNWLKKKKILRVVNDHV